MLVRLCAERDLDLLRAVGYSVARCGRARREAGEEFLGRYESDRRHGLRMAVLYARMYQFEDEPRSVLTEIRRVLAQPGTPPWAAVADVLSYLWSRSPREMFRLMPGWLTHRDPRRRWAALPGLQFPARKDPRAALKVMRLMRGERDPSVRRVLGRTLAQGLYVRHPLPALQEMARWLGDGAKSAPAITRSAEREVDRWFSSGRGSRRQRLQLRRVAAKYEEHRSPAVRAHARRLVRLLED
jgi:hypothetical protein